MKKIIFSIQNNFVKYYSTNEIKKLRRLENILLLKFCEGEFLPKCTGARMSLHVRMDGHMSYVRHLWTNTVYICMYMCKLMFTNSGTSKEIWFWLGCHSIIHCCAFIVFTFYVYIILLLTVPIFLIINLYLFIRLFTIYIYMEWLDSKFLQLIKLYKEKIILWDFYIIRENLQKYFLKIQWVEINH